MTEHIDLGDELADWSEPAHDPRQKPEQPVHQPTPDGGSTVPLADLQAAGFNTTPPLGYSAGGPNWRLLSASGGGSSGRSISVSIGPGGGQPGGGGSGGGWIGGNGGLTFIPPDSPYYFTFDTGDSDD